MNALNLLLACAAPQVGLDGRVGSGEEARAEGTAVDSDRTVHQPRLPLHPPLTALVVSDVYLVWRPEPELEKAMALVCSSVALLFLFSIEREAKRILFFCNSVPDLHHGAHVGTARPDCLRATAAARRCSPQL